MFTKREPRKPSIFEYLILFLCAMVVTFFSGFTLSTLWAWFVVPMGVLAISTPVFVGLTSIWRLLTIKIAPEGTPEETVDYQWRKLVTGVLHCFMALFLGWFATLFM